MAGEAPRAPLSGLRITDELTELVLHVLAHVRLAGPGTLRSPRYLAWVDSHAVAGHAAMLREGAAVLERAWGRNTPALVHAWPELHGSVAELRAHADTSFAELRPSQVRSPKLLHALQGLEAAPTERFYSMLRVAADGHAELWREHAEPELSHALERVARWWEPALAVLPSLGGSSVELCHVLGPRGRVYGDRIVIGAPTRWNELDPRVSVVLAMHEQLVHDAEGTDYVDVEWDALTGLAVRMREAPLELREIHRDWLASLHLSPLLDALYERGRLGDENRRRLEERPLERAPVLEEDEARPVSER